MNNLIEDYRGSIRFEEVSVVKLTVNTLKLLESKHGVVVLNEESVNLWIHRDLSVRDILGAKVVMESNLTFNVADDFGMYLWSGSSEDVVEYVKGYITGETEYH